MALYKNIKSENEITIKGQSAVAGAASSSEGKFYFKTDGKPYALWEDGAEVDLSAAGTPAGADTQIQFNNAGAFGAITNLTTDGIDVTLLDGGKLKIGTGGDGEISSSADDLYIKNTTLDKDIIFKVNKGGVDTEVMRMQGSTGTFYGFNPTFLSPSGGTNEFSLKTEGAINQRFSLYRQDDTAIDYLKISKNFTIATINASDNLDLQTGDTSRLKILGNGNVGIGITEPSTKLHQYASGTENNIHVLDIASDGSGDPYTLYRVRTVAQWTVGLDNSDGDKYKISTNSFDSGTSLTIDRSGNVGIGTTTPQAKLNVSGTNVLFNLDGNVVEPSFTYSNLVDGANNGGSIYFGFSRQAGAHNPTAAIETSWGGGTSPQMALGVIRDGRRAWMKFHFDHSTTFYTADTPRMRIRSDGYIGIGTTSPSYKLDVAGDINSSTGLFINGVPVGTSTSSYWSLNGSNVFYGNSVGIGTSTPSTALDVTGNVNIGGSSPIFRRALSVQFNNNADGIALKNEATGGRSYSIVSTGGTSAMGQGKLSIFDDTAATTRFLIDSSGNVGIGTITPSGQFHVSKDADEQVNWVFENISTGTTNAQSNLYVRNGNTSGDALRMGVMGVNRASLGSYRQNGASVTSEANLTGGLSLIARNATSGIITFTTGGYASEKMRITTDGDVGIGTDSPAEKLDVAGNIKLSDITDTARSIILERNSLNVGSLNTTSSITTLQAANDNGVNILNNAATGLTVEDDGTLNVATVTDYETLVTADDDIPNKKYVDDNAGGGISWVEVTGTTQTAVEDNGYITNNVSQVVVTLPATCAVGKVVRIAGSGAGGWQIAQNAGQTINFGNSATTSGATGYLESTNRYDSVELLCITADTTFVVLSSVGNITVN